MNGAYTPGLMKKMKHPIQKRYCNNPTKQMGAATHAVGHNRTDNVLMKTSYPDSYLMQKGDNVLMQMRGVKTDIHSIQGGSPNPKPISMSLHGGPSVPRTSEEAQAIITAEANRRSGRDTINTKDKNIGSNPGGRVAQHGSPLGQTGEREPVAADSSFIKKHHPRFTGGYFAKTMKEMDERPKDLPKPTKEMDSDHIQANKIWEGQAINLAKNKGIDVENWIDQINQRGKYSKLPYGL